MGGTRVLLKHLAALGIPLGMLTIFATSGTANQLDTAIVTATCTGYTIDVTASNLTVGQSYLIEYVIDSQSGAIGGGSIPFTASSSNYDTGPITMSWSSPLTQTTDLTGDAQLESPNVNYGGIDLTFSNDNAPQLVLTCPPPPPPCTAQSSIPSNFNGTPINAGDYIWFNANFTASGIPSNGTTLYLNNSTIQFTADQTYTVAVPNAQITFSPSATCATTTFDLTTNTWMTTVPINAGDEVFLSGVAFPVPAGFAKVNGQVKNPVVWQGTFGTNNTPGVNIQWKWGAAVYGTCFSSAATNYNSLDVKPTHQNACNLNNGDHAGTPENTQYQQCVTGGAGGGGGSNFTGSWSGTLSVSPSCP
jgi:hypothetical protein